MQTAQKKRQDEKNAKALRELAALPANRNCFECGQRGPTYVNITEGSFCCTQCSGILRGLNPPHRVKSISMATFSTEEIEKIRSLGNAENAKTWLALYSGAPPAMTNRERIQEHLVDKYEKKKWYVSRAEMAEQERLMNRVKDCNASVTSERSVASNSSKGPELDLFSNDPFAMLGPSPSSTPSARSAGSNSSAPTLDSVFPAAAPSYQQQPFSPPTWIAPPPPFPELGPPAHQLPARPDNRLATTLVTQSQTAQPHVPSNPPSSTFDAFADFDSKFNDLSLKPSVTSVFPSAAPSVYPSLTKSATVDSSFPGVFPSTVPVVSSAPAPAFPPPSNTLFSAPITNPLNPTNGSSAASLPGNSSVTGPATSVTAPMQVNAGDKYSALAELDELFHHTGNSSGAGIGEGKPAWMPSGFSTGLPPSHHQPAFPEPKPTINAMTPNTLNGFGSMPKSSTMGAISDYGVKNPFLNGIGGASAASFSQTDISTNPFASGFAQPQQFPVASSQSSWGQMPVAQKPTPALNPSNVSANTNWNPFL